MNHLKRLNDQYFKSRENHRHSFDKRGLILWIFLLVVFVAFVILNVGQQLISQETIPQNGDTTFCLPPSEFALGPVAYQDTEQIIYQKMKEPVRIIENPDLNYHQLIYDDLEISITGDHIFYLKAMSHKMATPSGIRLGMSKKVVLQKLHNKIGGDITSFNDEIQVVNCETEMFLVLEFTAGKLETLEMGIDLP